GLLAMAALRGDSGEQKRRSQQRRAVAATLAGTFKLSPGIIELALAIGERAAHVERLGIITALAECSPQVALHLGRWRAVDAQEIGHGAVDLERVGVPLLRFADKSLGFVETVLGVLAQRLRRQLSNAALMPALERARVVAKIPRPGGVDFGQGGEQPSVGRVGRALTLEHLERLPEAVVGIEQEDLDRLLIGLLPRRLRRANPTTEQLAPLAQEERGQAHQDDQRDGCCPDGSAAPR